MDKPTVPDVIVVALQERVNQLFDELREHAEEIRKTKAELRLWERDFRRYIEEVLEISAYIDQVGDEEMDRYVESTKAKIAKFKLEPDETTE